MDPAKRNAAVFIAAAALDQILKAAVQAARPDIDLGAVWIHELRNTGASFGIFQGSNTILIFVSLMALGLIMVNVRGFTRKEGIPITLVSAGIAGNLIDRVARGYVVDFFDLKWWPAFNLADSCIFIGVIWLAAILIIDEKEKQDKSALSAAAAAKKQPKRIKPGKK